MNVNDLLKRAAHAAARFNHDRIEAEHVLVALAEAQSPVGDALRACGITAGSVTDAIASLSPGYHKIRARRAGAPVGGPKWLGRATQELVARAHGLALGHGDTSIGDEHLLLSLLWSGAPLVQSVLDQNRVTGEQIMTELLRRDVSLPTCVLPHRRSWGSWVTMPTAELEEMTAELRRTGTLYRYKPGTDGPPSISIAEDGLTGQPDQTRRLAPPE